MQLKYGGGGRIRTCEAEAADLQSAGFDRSPTPPYLSLILLLQMKDVNQKKLNKKIIKSFFKDSSFSNTKVIIFKELDSTNQYLMDLEIQNTDRLICAAEKQYKGRGRGNKTWESPNEENIYLSISLLTEKYINLDGFSLMVGLTIRDCLEELYGINSKIKWPNDIYHENKKFCGILIETKPQKDKIKLVTGIGLNVFMDNNTNINQEWTSLKLINGNNVYDRNKIIGMATLKFFENLKLFEKHGFSFFKKRFNEHNYIKNKIVKTERYNNQHCKVLEVDSSGRMKVSVDKEIKHISSGELSLKVEE